MTLRETVSYWLERAHTGDCDSAFFGLIELGTDALPVLYDAFRSERDENTRVLIVNVVRQSRVESSIAFLASVLAVPSPEAWKQAIDGLVTIASPEAVAALQAARPTGFSQSASQKELSAWIDEAIGQIALNS